MPVQTERTVTVCDACLRASCWQGRFYCDESHTTAGLTEKTVAELEALGREHPEYWEEGAGVDFPAGQKDTWKRSGNRREEE